MKILNTAQKITAGNNHKLLKATEEQLQPLGSGSCESTVRSGCRGGGETEIRRRCSREEERRRSGGGAAGRRREGDQEEVQQGGGEMEIRRRCSREEERRRSGGGAAGSTKPGKTLARLETLARQRETVAACTMLQRH
ncbi:unnamed protein product [Pleuronectes platessa]|uniref:Uncharacterized protein n=1 Tax=Pleuronectes platessa TaxID=8262 RepID=A0A9N7TJ00_PLEPL|nr:unnamed protein product [Pleuronectes platessa]